MDLLIMLDVGFLDTHVSCKELTMMMMVVKMTKIVIVMIMMVLMMMKMKMRDNDYFYKDDIKDNVDV